MSYKSVIFDLDGTLAPIGGCVTAKDLEFMRRLHDHGLNLVICSGKPAFYLCGFIRQLGIPDMWIVGENGAVVQQGIGLPPTVGTIFPCAPEVRNTLYRIRRDLEEKIPGLWFQPNEIAVTPFPKREEEFAIITDYLEKHKDLLKGLTVFRHVDSFDILPSGMTKYYGLQKLTELTGIAPEEMIAVGDGVNDVPMFQYAGLSLGIKLWDCQDVDEHFPDITSVLSYLCQKVLNP